MQFVKRTMLIFGITLLSTSKLYANGLGFNYPSNDNEGRVATPADSFDFLDIKKTGTQVSEEAFLYSFRPKSNRTGLLTNDRQNTRNTSLTPLNYESLEIRSRVGTVTESFEFLNIKRADSQASGEAFLYSIMPKSNRIGLLTYDRQSTINPSIVQLNYEALEILECGSEEGFISRKSVYNYERIMGVTGYEKTDSPCHIARNKEFKWFNGLSLGVNTWYSKSLDGDVQCYSLDGWNCIWQPDYTKSLIISNNKALRSLENNQVRLGDLLNEYNQLILKTQDGAWTSNIKLPNISDQRKRIVVDVNSTWSVNVHLPNGKHRTVPKGGEISWIYLGGEWFEEGTNVNDYAGITQLAKPLTCGKEHKRRWGETGYSRKEHWCSKLIKPKQTHAKQTLQSTIDSKFTHMDRLFTQMESFEQLKIDTDNDYPSRLSDLSRKRNSKAREKDIACALGWWNIPGLIACSILSSQYDDLSKAYASLSKERNAKRNSARDKVELGRKSRWHELHKTWAQSDNTHFVALLKEESATLEELKSIKAEYDKEARQAHAEYLKAIQDYMNETDPRSILIHSIEDLPLVGPEVKHIVDYAESPSDRNLRRMLLGLAGPVGEVIEGGIELTTGESGLDPGTLKFLTDVLTDLRGDDSLGAALEDIVSDAINNLGDEAIESIRQAGLWRDNPGEENLLQVDYQNIIDLRSQSERIEYDFWRGGSNEEINAQRKFTPDDFRYARFLENPLAYNQASLTDIEYASGGSQFESRLASIFNHTFGLGYQNVVKENPKYSSWTRSQVNEELYKVLSDPAYYEVRQPYWVDSSVIGSRPAGLIFNDEHAFIVLNRKLVSRDSPDFYKFYFEELGHMLNWWRCKIFDVRVSFCQITGDVGARFRDAILLDESLHTGPFVSLLAELPNHVEVDQNTLQFTNGSFATLEGWPSYYTMNDHIAGAGKFSWLMRLGLDVTSEEFKFISDEFDMEVTISAPQPALKDNPWKKSANGYCKTDLDTECNMPTMWVSIAFRDALKLSVTKTPQIKDSQFAKTGFDLSPRLVRKHGGKLPFQLSSVKSTQWNYKSDYNIYSKKFTAGLEAKLDLWKMNHAIGRKTPSKMHKPEFSLKTTPASGSYLVEIATRDTTDFAGWLAGDIASSIAGCAAGFAIGVVAETDPVVLCHTMSDVTEAVESAFQGLDKKPTMLFESDGNVTLPISLEYKYATSGNKLAGNTSPSTSDFKTGRVTYNPDTGTNVWFTDGSMHPVSRSTDQQISSFKGKASKAFSKLGKSTLSPVAVFRFRVGFDYAEEVIQKGEYALPSAIVED
ncbi:conserved hypothetical protein [Vibrio crassostreae]|uniref:Metalloprotease StcE beta-sandwich domain-containing protein n=1 Tax=Vibrio crassostreae TaxID=246167 RepID=A0A822N7T6_9VIBR|nr:hypothetical protein [Vibrio crassostreae]MDH5951642.1 hypothetical protein [Vibrio crassostreae]TCN04928.1 hypothetical protein EDB35_12080 [Vibrio crassostreae]TCU06720.1 hypothetical protein EDB32_11380 [Vibrio crassostreae]CAK2108501.1 conserved hypothetical protein [Vibrio crassostreae]CAK2887281.1 conserved hypothetical protein [Vibrio crassostreae]